MGPTCKSYVLELLENSSHRLRQIELMRYELQHARDEVVRVCSEQLAAKNHIQRVRVQAIG